MQLQIKFNIGDQPATSSSSSSNSTNNSFTSFIPFSLHPPPPSPLILSNKTKISNYTKEDIEFKSPTESPLAKNAFNNPIYFLEMRKIIIIIEVTNGRSEWMQWNTYQSHSHDAESKCLHTDFIHHFFSFDSSFVCPSKSLQCENIERRCKLSWCLEHFELCGMGRIYLMSLQNSTNSSSKMQHNVYIWTVFSFSSYFLTLRFFSIFHVLIHLRIWLDH